MDNLTKQQRSLNMSRIRSKWTSQEKKVHNYLKANKIKHKMHPNIEGSPDILITDTKTAVFLNGCFWHKCPKHYVAPKSDKKYWLSKIKNNLKRDKKNTKLLKAKGYNVIKIWEHQVKTDMKRIITDVLKI